MYCVNLENVTVAKTVTTIEGNPFINCFKLEHVEVTDHAITPTCTETGLTEGSYCIICGEVYTEQTVIEALGHVEDNMIIENVIEPTETVTGSHDEVIYCEKCGEEISRNTIID